MTETIKVIDIMPDEARHLAQRLHRKKEDIEIYRKSLIGEIEGSSDEERTLIARVSTSDRDRDGEIVEPTGIDVKDFSANPVLLWAHSYATPPVGKALWSKTDERGLICKFQFAKTQFADEIYTLYRDGYLKAFSIGFISLDFDAKERVYKRISLLEVSCVPVPANQSALVMEAYTKGIVTSDALKKDLGIEDEPAVEAEEKAVDDAEPTAETEVVAEEKAEVVNKPETTENYHRIPVSNGHGDHQIRTIDVTDGVKALYCVDCKEIATYLFDVDKFTMEEAREWVEEHRDGKGVDVEAGEPEAVVEESEDVDETKSDDDDTAEYVVTELRSPQLDDVIKSISRLADEFVVLRDIILEDRAKTEAMAAIVRETLDEPATSDEAEPCKPAPEGSTPSAGSSICIMAADPPARTAADELVDYVRSDDFGHELDERIAILIDRAIGRVR